MYLWVFLLCIPKWNDFKSGIFCLISLARVGPSFPGIMTSVISRSIGLSREVEYIQTGFPFSAVKTSYPLLVRARGEKVLTASSSSTNKMPIQSDHRIGLRFVVLIFCFYFAVFNTGRYTENFVPIVDGAVHACDILFDGWFPELLPVPDLFLCRHLWWWRMVRKNSLSKISGGIPVPWSVISILTHWPSAYPDRGISRILF